MKVSDVGDGTKTIDTCSAVELPDEAFNKTYGYIEKYWEKLVRTTSPADKSTLHVPHPYVVPSNGIFELLFYWDSHFTMMGLAVQGRNQLIKNTVDDLIYLMETYGIIPNANYCGEKIEDSLSRSQPPYLTSMIKEVLKYDWDMDWLKRAFEIAKREYAEVWLDGGRITPTGLSRYYDKIGGKEEDGYGIHFGAENESGWDRSPRFSEALNLNPIDLNCCLYRYERDFAAFSRILGKENESGLWEAQARQRQDKVNEYMWDEKDGLFYDYHYVEQRKTEYKTLAAFQPLWSGLATKEQAKRLVANIRLFDQPGGLSICDRDYGAKGMQWNYPTGFAMTQWLVTKGIKDYGYHQLASDLAYKWLKLNADIFEKTGKIWEKHNVVDKNLEVPCRYSMQEGFGFTNGIFAALIGKVIFGMDFDVERRKYLIQPCTPTAWKGKRLSITFVNYLLPRPIKMELSRDADGEISGFQE